LLQKLAGWLALRVSWLVAYSPNSSQNGFCETYFLRLLLFEALEQNGFCETYFLRLLLFEAMESVLWTYWTAMATIGRDNIFFFSQGEKLVKHKMAKLR